MAAPFSFACFEAVDWVILVTGILSFLIYFADALYSKTHETGLQINDAERQYSGDIMMPALNALEIASAISK